MCEPAPVSLAELQFQDSKGAAKTSADLDMDDGDGAGK
jgi:hypothetical protein